MGHPAFRCSSGIVPVFPLPGVVFFPKTVLPLHVFEPRYRSMVRDAVAGEGLIAVSLLLPGWEETYEESPEFHEVGTVGRIEDLEPLADGRFNLRLVGLQRVSFGELVRPRPYRSLHVLPLGETAIDERDPDIRRAKLDLLASHACLLRELVEGQQPAIIPDETIPFETVVNGACANLPVEPVLRQGLLEENCLRERHRRASRLLNEVLERVLKLKARRCASDGAGDLN